MRLLSTYTYEQILHCQKNLLSEEKKRNTFFLSDIIHNIKIKQTVKIRYKAIAKENSIFIISEEHKGISHKCISLGLLLMLLCLCAPMYFHNVSKLTLTMPSCGLSELSSCGANCHLLMYLIAIWSITEEPLDIKHSGFSTKPCFDILNLMLTL